MQAILEVPLMTTPLPLAVMAVPPLRNEGIRHLLRSWDTLLVVASRHREARSNPFTIDLCKICFKKKKSSISFPVTYPTTNDNSRLQTFVQRVGFDNWRFFATQSKKNRKWKSYNKERLGPYTPNSRANRKKP